MTNSINKLISCDIIIVVTNYQGFISLLTKQASQAKWLRHNFIAILNMSESDEQNLQSWYYESRVDQILPEVTLIKAKEGTKSSNSAMYHTGVVAGGNPYIYFQNEKDDLPLNIDKTIFRLHKNPHLHACFGRTETFLANGTELEKFPLLDNNGEFKYDCYEASRLFPSYAYPLSGVFKRSIFEKYPYWDIEYRFKEFTYYHFMLRILEDESMNVEFLPYTIKKSRKVKESDGGMSVELRAKLIHDIRLWLPEHPENDYKDFQRDILQLLVNNEITTFKEIDARIEDYLESK